MGVDAARSADENNICSFYLCASICCVKYSDINSYSLKNKN